MAEKFIDIPFVEAEYKFDDWIKYLIFMHILPYMLKPALDDWKGFALPISLYIQTLLLKNMKNSNHRLKTQIEALEDSKYKKLNFCTSHYRREFDFYHSIGGNGALLEAFTLREIKEFIQDKAEYFMAVHAMVKYYMNWVDGYKKDKSNPEPSFNECFLRLRNRLSDYPYQTLAEKALEEGAWKEFKYSAHLVYGYIETLLEKGQIPQIPEGNVVNFIKSNVANVLTKFDDNYLFLKRMLIHSFKAQDVLLKHKHSKSSRNLELWLLPEHLKKQYKLGV